MYILNYYIKPPFKGMQWGVEVCVEKTQPGRRRGRFPLILKKKPIYIMLYKKIMFDKFS